MNFFTITIVEKAIDAHLIKSSLESEGLFVFLKDEHTVGMLLHYNLLLGGIKIQVPELYAKKAVEILAEIENTPFFTEQDAILKCPSCSSHNLMDKYKTYGVWRGILAYLSMLFLAVYPIYYKEKYRCKDCGHLFENNTNTNK